MWQIWLIIAIIFFILEMMGPGFLLFWVGVGALLAMVTSLFIDNIVLQIAIFTISSAALLFFTRPLAKKFNENDNTITNANSIIGKKGIVIKEVNPSNGTGQIKINSEIWSAKSSTDTIIEEGSEISILSIDGVKAIVEKSNEYSTK